jgi:hypothetical protein
MYFDLQNVLTSKMVIFFQKIIDVLDQHNIPYMLSGSIAMGLKNLDLFVDSFKDGYYCDKDGVREAIETSFKMFNIIDYASGYKADFIVLKNEAFREEEFSRRVQMEFYGKIIYVVSPEDLLISKLIWIQDLQSPVQMEDISNLIAFDGLDWTYIEKWINQLKLNTFDLLNK